MRSKFLGRLGATPDIIYIFMSHIHDNRRVYTDGRDWPEEIEKSFQGYAIGK